MTNKALNKQLKKRADAARAAGQHVDINETLPCVLVYRGEDDEFFLQGEAAEELLESVPDWADSEDYLLATAQDW